MRCGVAADQRHRTSDTGQGHKDLILRIGGHRVGGGTRLSQQVYATARLVRVEGGADVTLRSILSSLKHGDVALPTLIRVPDKNVLVDGYAPELFEVGTHYFTVRSNMLSLQHSRNWFTTWQPMLVSVVEFRYGGSEISVPFVVGPSMLKPRTDVEVPLATVFAGTEVVGVHPYAGDRLAVTMLLYRVKHDDYAKKILDVAQQIAGAFDLSTVLTQYLRVAGAVEGAIDSILGAKDTTPVLGYRIEFNPNAADVFRPGYFALLTGETLSSERLWVRDHMLLTGDTEDAARAPREDAVLFSITGSTTRNDVANLPWFRPLWQQLVRAASTGTVDGKRAVKAHLAYLYENLMLSDDVARAEVATLYAAFEKQAHETFDVAKKRAQWAPKEDALQRAFVEILS